MKYAKLEKSARLQRLLKFLRYEKEQTTLEIVRGAKICAVSAAVSELRRNIEPMGVFVHCRKVGDVYTYKLAEYPQSMMEAI